LGKNKLARWNELDTFMNVIQTGTGKVSRSDHPVRGRWREQIFRNDNPIVLELGCGRGEYTVALAERYPDTNFIGIDIKGARLWRGAKTSNERKLSNAAFLRTIIEFLA
jgi:tRNA (guanine-N7-)-methyltransferase